MRVDGLLNRTGMQGLRNDAAFMSRVERGSTASPADIDHLHINDRLAHPHRAMPCCCAASPMPLRDGVREGDSRRPLWRRGSS